MLSIAIFAVCSACIRENLSFQERQGHAQCPSCRTRCDARDLIANVALRETTERYISARPIILSLANALMKLKKAPESKTEELKKEEKFSGPTTRKKRKEVERTEDEVCASQSEPAPKTRRSYKKAIPPVQPQSSSQPLRRSRRRMAMQKSLNDGEVNNVHDSQEKKASSSMQAELAENDGISIDLTADSMENGSDGKDGDFSNDDEDFSDEDEDEFVVKTSKRSVRASRKAAVSSRGEDEIDKETKLRTDEINGGLATQPETTPSGFVNCPICGRGVPSFYINSHVDQCLLTESLGKKGSGNKSMYGDVVERPGESMPSSAFPKNRESLESDDTRSSRAMNNSTKLGHHYLGSNGSNSIKFQPLNVPPKLVAAITTEKTLRTSLKKFNLPTDGKKPDLMARYNAFRIAVQTANDRGEPTSYSRIASHIASQERRRAVAATISGNLGNNAVATKYNTDSITTRYKLSSGIMSSENEKELGIAGTNNPGLTNENNPMSVSMGCSFEELIAITKARDEARKKEALRDKNAAFTDANQKSMKDGDRMDSEKNFTAPNAHDTGGSDNANIKPVECITEASNVTSKLGTYPVNNGSLQRQDVLMEELMAAEAAYGSDIEDEADDW